jgi:hypothetical protein
MTTLRQAAQQALEALHYGKANKAVTILREALEQPVQEPVGDEWTPCMKLPVVVHVRKQRSGEAHVSTREGITPVKPDDLIMRGVSGEEYPIGRAIFEQTYSLDTTPPAATVQEPHKGLSEHLAQATNGRVHIDPVTGDVGIGTPAAQRKPLTDDVLVPLEILEAAASSLDSFCGDLGWGDADLQNMDNLFALISQHKAAYNIKEGT